jgi:hypothetical protein
MIFWIIVKKNTGKILSISDYKKLKINEDEYQIKAPHDFPIGCRKIEYYYDFDFKTFRKNKPEKLRKWFLNLFDEEKKVLIKEIIQKSLTIDEMTQKINQENLK